MVGFDLASAAYTGYSSAVFSILQPHGIYIQNSGEYAFITHDAVTVNVVTSHRMTTPFSLATMTQTASFAISTNHNRGITFSASGADMFIVNAPADAIQWYKLSTPWSVATASLRGTKGTSAVTTAGQDIYMMPSGGLFYELTNTHLIEWKMSTPFSLATATVGYSLALTLNDSNHRALWMQDTGAKFFTSGFTNDRVYAYEMVTPWSLATTALLEPSFAIASQEGNPGGIFFQDSGAYFYVVGDDADRILEYKIAVDGAPTASAASIASFLNIGDQWKGISNTYVNIGDVWKTVSNQYVNIGDTWKKIQ